MPVSLFPERRRQMPKADPPPPPPILPRTKTGAGHEEDEPEGFAEWFVTLREGSGEIGETERGCDYPDGALVPGGCRW